MAIVVWGDFSKTVSFLHLDQRCTGPRELRSIRIEEQDERHKSLIFINAYIHPSIRTTGPSLEFLEGMEDNPEAQS